MAQRSPLSSSTSLGGSEPTLNFSVPQFPYPYNEAVGLNHLSHPPALTVCDFALGIFIFSSWGLPTSLRCQLRFPSHPSLGEIDSPRGIIECG